MGTRKCDNKQKQSSLALVQQKSDASKCITGIIIPVISNFFLSGARSEMVACISVTFCYFVTSSYYDTRVQCSNVSRQTILFSKYMCFTSVFVPWSVTLEQNVN
jgi:hypothetical protein